MKYKTEVEVRYQETDAMGVVHHSVYPIWFELARISCLREEGFPYEVLEERGEQIPVIGLEVSYLRPVKFGHFVKIEFTLSQDSPSKFSFHYQLTESEQIVAKGSTQHVFMNPKGRPIRPPQAFTDHFFRDT
jgi:acyl-CoA thioester hydrolase